MQGAGTTIVAGTSPTKAGQTTLGVPIYQTAQDASEQHHIDISVIFVPAPFAKAAILEAIAAHIPLIVCITEGIPIHDMIEIRRQLRLSTSTLLGPNSPGFLIPGEHRLGIIPDTLSTPGSVAIVSRSGTLTYEAMDGLTRRGIGQRYVIGIGGDPVKGSNFIDYLQLFQDDPEVTSIIMIGEVGGVDEQASADFIAESVTKPVYAYIAGHAAPAGVQLGHAGAILGSNQESAPAKTAYLQRKGLITAVSITDLVDKVR